MLKPISRLRLACKGNLNNTFYSNVHRIRKKIYRTIPVLSIFAFLGIITYSTIVIGFGEVEEVRAEETYTDSNTSLIIDNGELKNDNRTADGDVIYSSHIVRVKADNITGYSLTITGPVGLDGGTSSTPITGAENKTLANMADNTWGYAWDKTTIDEENMTYASFTGDMQTITKTTATSGATNNPNVSSYKVNFTRKLVFAAKFSDNATNGHYRANVKLNLIVTPRTLMNYAVFYNMNGGAGGPENVSGITNGNSYTYTIPDIKPTKSGYSFLGYNSDNSTSLQYKPGNKITLSSINPNNTLYAVWQQIIPWNSMIKMQEMTAEACAGASTGASKTLTDARDNKSYTIKKLTDGNCWMIQNMKLDLGIVSLTPDDSDVTTTFTKGTAAKVTTSSNWSSNSAKAQWTPELEIAESSTGDGKGYMTEYGYYYSWCAATAETCLSATDYLTEASSSICPKGWHLPKGGRTAIAKNDFANLMNLEGVGLADPITDNISVSWSSKLNVGPPAYYTLADVKWYRAGLAASTGLNGLGSSAGYWSRTSFNTTYACIFTLTASGQLRPASETIRDFGVSVRCIAYSS